MVHIISRSGGPRREDVEPRRLIEQNRGVIERLANQFSQGRYAENKRAKQPPQPDGLVIHAGRAAPVSDAPKPYLRISPNRRVVVVDGETGRQMSFLGEIRRRDGVLVFAVATRENGFFSPVDAGTAATLAALDGRRLGRDYGEDDLGAEIRRLLAIA